jgi:uridine kinase
MLLFEDKVDVILLEGILIFQERELRELLDIKVTMKCHDNVDIR